MSLPYTLLKWATPCYNAKTENQAVEFRHFALDWHSLNTLALVDDMIILSKIDGSLKFNLECENYDYL